MERIDTFVQFGTVDMDDDLEGQVARTTTAIGAGQNANQLVEEKEQRTATEFNVSRYIYDAAGRQIIAVSGLAEPNLDGSGSPVESGVTYLPGTETAAAQRDNAPYESLSRTNTSTWAKGELTSFTYDYRLRTATQTSYPNMSKALTTQTVYLNNRVHYTMDAYGRRAFTLYDVNDRPKRQGMEWMPGTLGDGSDLATRARDLNPNPGYTIEDQTYDPEGQLTLRVDGRAIQHETKYDSRGRTVEQIEAKGTTVAARTVFEYDIRNNQTRIYHPRHYTEPGGFTSEFTYTNRNLLKSSKEALGRRLRRAEVPRPMLFDPGTPPGIPR